MAPHTSNTGTTSSDGGPASPQVGPDESERVLTFRLPMDRVLTVRVGLSSTNPVVAPPTQRRLGEVVLQYGVDEDRVLDIAFDVSEEFTNSPVVTPPKPHQR